MRLFLVLFLLSFNTFAADWSELEPQKSYKLTQSFQLKMMDRAGSLLDFTKGQKFKLNDIVPISAPGMVLTLYIFDYAECPGKDMETDMDIIPVNGTTPLVEVGAYITECELNVYLETKDYYSKSLFN